MQRTKLFLLVIGFILTVTFFTTKVFAGGGPVEFTVDPNTPLDPGSEYVVHARVYADGPYPTYCKQCSIHLELKFPQDGDYIAQSSDKTGDDGTVYAKVISKVPGERVVLATNIETPDGVNITSNSYAILPYKGEFVWASPYPTSTQVLPSPSMVYPVDGQTIDLEGAYMFKVNPVPNATGYLFGLFQDGNMVYENYRDDHILSSNGEFALWESHPFHAKFHQGPMQVIIRAMVNNNWTDGRGITVYLKPRGSSTTNTGTTSNQPIPTFYPEPTLHPGPTGILVLPTVLPEKPIIVVTDSSASAALQQKIDSLQQQLDESKQKQAETESKLNQIIAWIKSIFPFFK